MVSKEEMLVIIGLAATVSSNAVCTLMEKFLHALWKSGYVPLLDGLLGTYFIRYDTFLLQIF